MSYGVSEGGRAIQSIYVSILNYQVVGSKTSFTPLKLRSLSGASLANEWSFIISL
jgi:hypothetical protein